jgi:hypothetical protein
MHRLQVSNVSDVIGIPTHPSDAKQDVDTVKTSLQIRINTKPFAISDAFASVCSHT